MTINAKLWIKRCFIIFGLTAFMACGAGDDYTHTRPVQKGFFLDSAVSGLKYVTETQSGTTDTKGTFEYRKDETITFYVGRIFIGRTNGKSQITPLDLFPDASDISEACITNLCRFLQALDSDNDPENGILISTMVQNALSSHEISLDFEQNEVDFESYMIQNPEMTQLGLTLPDIKSSQKHLRKTLYGDLRDIQINADIQSLPCGMTLQLQALGTFEKTSELIDITRQVNWSTLENSIATISFEQPGLLESFSTGTTVIYASLDGQSNHLNFEIDAPILVELNIIPDNIILHPYQTEQVYARGSFSDKSIRDITYNVTWSSNKVNMSQKGLATAIAEGRGQIIAEYNQLVASANIEVTNGSLIGIEIQLPSNIPASDNLTIPKGIIKQLKAVGIFSDNIPQTITEQVVWSSEHNSIAKVSNKTGTKGFTEAISRGSTTISASLEGFSDDLQLVVIQAELDSIQISPQNKTIPINCKEQFKAVAIFSDITEEDITDQVIWGSDNPYVADFFDEDIHKGLLSSESIGTVKISALFQDLEGVAFVTVSDADLESIEVSPSIISVAMGSTYQFTATGLFSDGTHYEMTDTVDWTTTEFHVARVSNDFPNKGLINTFSSGTTFVRATFQTITGYASLTVRSPDLLSIRILPENITIERGASQQLQATGYYTDNAIVDITHLVEWQSSQPDILSVTNGFIEGLSIGSANITAEMDGISRFTTITVY